MNDITNYSDLMKRLRETMGSGNGYSWYGPSFMDQYRSANAGLDLANQYKGDRDVMTEQQEKSLLSGLKSSKGNAIAGGVMAGVSGVSNILTTSLNAAKIQDTSHYTNQINDLSLAGTQNYNDFDQLANDMSNTDFNVGVGYDDIRGMGGKGVTMEKVGAVGGSAMSGAAAGMQIGGPWGALIGGVIGLGAGLGGVLSGDQKAKIQQKYLQSQAQRAEDTANLNFAAAGERIMDNSNRRNMVNAVAAGGPIRRQSIMEYANRVASNPVRREGRYNRIISRKCNGGVMVRLKSR